MFGGVRRCSEVFGSFFVDRQCQECESDGKSLCQTSRHSQRAGKTVEESIGVQYNATVKSCWGEDE